MISRKLLNFSIWLMDEKVFNFGHIIDIRDEPARPDAAMKLYDDISRWGDLGGGFPPQEGNKGEFRKTDRTHTLVVCRRTYIPSFKTIGFNLEILEFLGGSLPLGGEWGEFRKSEK